MDAKGRANPVDRAVAEHAGEHPLFKLWAEREKVGKLCEFFGNLKLGVIHPRYNVLTRTGRTSCQGPNVQQIPRKGGFRELFVAKPGYFLLAGDYSYIELRTLAAVCEARFGFSRLADTVREGTDPHCFTAAMLLGMTLPQFMDLSQALDEVEESGGTKAIKG